MDTFFFYISSCFLYPHWNDKIYLSDSTIRSARKSFWQCSPHRGLNAFVCWKRMWILFVPFVFMPSVNLLECSLALYSLFKIGFVNYLLSRIYLHTMWLIIVEKFWLISILFFRFRSSIHQKIKPKINEN